VPDTNLLQVLLKSIWSIRDLESLCILDAFTIPWRKLFEITRLR
jgi:hypothetical protein